MYIHVCTYSGSDLCCTLSLICSALNAILFIRSLFKARNVVIGSIGLFANKWNEKLSSSSC